MYDSVGKYVKNSPNAGYGNVLGEKIICMSSNILYSETKIYVK